MDTLEKARETQLNNIQKKTGKSLAEFQKIIAGSGLTKHSEIRQMLIDRFGLGFGDAGQLVHYALNSDGQSAAKVKEASTDDLLAEIYSGSKAPLRPLYNRVLIEIDKLGEYSIAPKKGYFSFRRKRQFSMIGPGTKNRLEIGLNLKGIEGTERLISQPPGGMCQFKVFLSNIAEVDVKLFEWIKKAYLTSG